MLQAAGTVDMSGTAEGINTADLTWYLGSQQSLLAVLKFPGTIILIV